MGAGTLNVATMNVGLINTASGDTGSFVYVINQYRFIKHHERRHGHHYEPQRGTQ